jgi:hypothetical protein
MAAVWTGKRIAVVTRLAERDAPRLEPLRRAGIDVYATCTGETTRHWARHLSADSDERQVALLASAGPPTAAELDVLGTATRREDRVAPGGLMPAPSAADDRPPLLHLAALTDKEASVDFLLEAAARGFSVSVDLQGFVRRADPVTGEVVYGEVPGKREIVSGVDRVKLDAREARFLTGLASPEEAAIEMEAWGARETMITWSGGVLVRAGGMTFSERFTNVSVEGRTGRGDTTFGAYLACRLDEGPGESLRWAAAVASMKLEKAGLFAGTKERVRARMDAVRR